MNKIKILSITLEKRIISKNENDHSHQVIGQETEMTSKLEIRHKQRQDEIINAARRC
ncbi:TetR/AcrR family transcriptional regulator, partial [Escherichia coli]|nr:TetR/AcrR family transcriptional regulator [Escherichia coli]